MRNSEISIQNSNKDVLAKLMATENITVLHKKVPTAYFDVQNRTLVCPILKDDMSSEMYDLFMGHEVGHALHTPVEGWHQSVSELGMVFKGYLNVIEDVRIEKEIKAKYPGLRKSFYTGYRELNDDDFFGLSDKDINELNLIDKINIHYKVGSFARVEFTDEEKVYIKRCDNLKTFEEVMALAKELFEKQKAENKDKIESMTQDELQSLMDELGIEPEEDGNTEIQVPSEEGEEEQKEGEESSSTGTGDNEENEEEDEEGTGDTDSSDADNESDEQSEQKSSSKGKTPEEQLEDELNKSLTDEEFRENEGDLHASDYRAHEPKYYELKNRIKYNNFLIPWKEIDDLIEDKGLDRTNIRRYTKNFIDSNKKIVNYMVKEFEMKKAAADYKRSRSAKTGELNMDKLHQYLLKDDIFNRIQVVPDGKNHGVVMIIDWSGSMTGSVKPTIEQAALLSMFARRLQIPFRLYAFSDGYTKRDNNEEYEIYREKKASAKTKKQKEIIEQEYYDRNITRTFGENPFNENEEKWDLGNLNLLEIFNERMSNSEFVRSMENWFELGFHMDHYDYYYNNKQSLNFDTDFYVPHSLQLGGTPLDHSIILMRDYLQDFQRDYGLDITTFIALTDGESHGCIGYGNSALVDRRYNKVHKMTGYRGTTRGLLKWLKETTGVRTIGFYLTKPHGQKFFSEVERFAGVECYSFDDHAIEWRKEFNKLAVSIEDKKGTYDLAILINQKKIDIDYEEDELQVDVGANKGALKRALVKAGNNKMQQRVILNKFVQQMAV